MPKCSDGVGLFLCAFLLLSAGFSQRLELAKRPLHLIWIQNMRQAPTSSYLQTVLLGALERPIKVLIAEEGDVFRNDSLVVMHKHLGRYLYDASLKGIQNIGLFHTGDEENLVEKSTYAYADYVIRHCYFPSYRINKNTPDEARTKTPDKDSILWVHHGYANGVGPRESATLLSPEDREMLCFYSGSATHPARMHMLQVITNNSLPCFTETTRGFLKGMTPYVFSALMQNSETIRLYDAMECGAIPVLAGKHPFLQKMADAVGEPGGLPPFVFLDSWDDLVPYIRGLTQDLQLRRQTTLRALASTQKRVITFWKDFQRVQQLQIRDLIDSHFT